VEAVTEVTSWPVPEAGQRQAVNNCFLDPLAQSRKRGISSRPVNGSKTTPPTLYRGSENSEGISSSDEGISAHSVFQQA